MQRTAGPTPAQWYCRLAGLVLLIVGIVGFFVEPDFGTTARDELILFDINGWHNVVHLLSGIVLLAVAGSPGAAKAVALAFGIVYGAVAIIGLIDGDDVLGFIPINAADNVLHIGLSALAIIAALVSERPSDETHLQSWGRPAT
ncbi:MAG TPA: DUF4383 domain-containing protein [Capillimicrobium sp.]|nr:DUF4383 domain-containing protein [Capillimicrobium sp.]